MSNFGFRPFFPLSLPSLGPKDLQHRSGMCQTLAKALANPSSTREVGCLTSEWSKTDSFFLVKFTLKFPVNFHVQNFGFKDLQHRSKSLKGLPETRFKSFRLVWTCSKFKFLWLQSHFFDTKPTFWSSSPTDLKEVD